MLTNFFDTITRLSVRFRWITFAFTLFILAAGFFAYRQLNQELTPAVEFPQTIVVAQWGDSDSTEQMLAEITEPLEIAMQGVEGVVNVESTTNQSLAFIIVRNEFGLNQTNIRAEIEDAIDLTNLPDEVEPDVINFSLSDLPVVIASVASSDRSLPELKALIENELQADLLAIEDVSEVSIGGGQELPEVVEEEEEIATDEEEIVEVEPTIEPTVELIVEEERSRLVATLIGGLRVYGIQVEYADEITPEDARGLIYNGGDLATQALELLTPENLRAGEPATLAYLPVEYVETLDEELAAELDKIAADFGGIGQYTIEEALTAKEAGLDVLTNRPIEDGTIADVDPIEVTETPEDSEETDEAAEAVDNEQDEIVAVDLPDTWIAAAAAQDVEIETTDDLSPQLVTGIAQFAPDLLEELTGEMLLGMSSEVIAALPQDYLETLDEELLAQLATTEVEPVDLPDSWIEAAEAQNVEIETTADLMPPLVAGISQFAPELLNDLTDDMLLAMTPEVVAALPQDYLATLDEELLAQLATEVEETVVEVEPVDLPESWIAAAEAQNVEIATTADLSPQLVTGIAQFAPDLLDELTNEMLLAMPPEVFAALPTEFVESLDEEFLATLVVVDDVTEPVLEPVQLPQSWIAAARAQNIDLDTTADLNPALVEGIAQVAPQLLEELTDEMILAMTTEVVAALPVEYVESLDEEVQEALAARAAVDEVGDEVELVEDPTTLPEQWVAIGASQGIELETSADLTPEIVAAIASFMPAAFEQLTPDMLRGMSADALTALPIEFLEALDTAVQDDLLAVMGLDELPKPVPVDPTLLPEIFATIGEQVGTTLETTEDITPEFVRQLGAFGEQGIQLLQLLSEDNLRLLDPQAIALLPADFLDTIEDDNLRIYLDGLSVEYGGAGQLAITEAEEAAALSADAPPLPSPWSDPNPQGDESAFQTTADFIANPFTPDAASLLNSIPNSPQVDDPRDWMGVLDQPIIQFIAENEPTFAENFQPTIAELLPSDSINYLLENFPDAYDDETTTRLADIAAGDVEVFVPESTITRNDGNPSLVLLIYKDGDANTVNVFHEIDEVMEGFKSAESDINVDYVFEQSTFIEESIEGVTREGALGALFAVIVILIFLSGRVNGRYRPSIRATLITGLSIPSSVLFAFLLMWLLPASIGPWINRMGENNVIFAQLAKLFPTEITLNIMTLSGLTVAIGRVVDDSIVVLENSYRYIQKGQSPLEAVYRGTKEVAVAIFAATITTMAVFLPLGFVGGVISQFFLPFGLTVTYALAASFIVSITVVPALTALLIRRENIPEERETALQRGYTPVLEWCLNHRLITMGVATLIFIGSLFLLGTLPNSFIPSLGDPTINVSISLPEGTNIIETNEQLAEYEEILQRDVDGLESILTEVGTGGGGAEALFGGGGGVSQNLAALTIAIEEGEDVDLLTQEVRESAEAFFGEEQVTVGAAAQSGFGGFAIIVTGDDLAEIVENVPDVEAALATLDADADGTPDLVNITSNAEAAAGGTTIIRIDGQPAISFGADLMTADTIGVAAAAIEAANQVLPSDLVAAEGFDSQEQAEGFTSMISAIGVSIILVYLIMALAFRSLIHPLTILFTLPFALVGAAIALFVTNSVLGISAMMGLLMLVGVVVTNGIVLLELVQQLRDEGVATYESLVEGGRTRIRPIWMTALTAILALIPLALSSEGGAIIAAELGTAVIGGLIVSTALTLVVIPVVYSLFDQGMDRYYRWQYKRIGKRLGVGGD